MDHAVLETSSDRYVIQEYLAEGGMGAIYLGKKLGVGGFEKEVVLKQLLPEFTSEPQFIDLFLREARISASLDHANIVHTIDLVAAEKDFFIVMEYVRGADLRTIMRRAKRRGKQLSAQAALHIGHEIADALSYAHNKVKPDGRPLGLIHRDVSPSNILISGSGEVKLTDFGIAKASTHRSVFYRVKGKVGYMSPEQARGESIDARSDLYSLAVCVYEALVGERLFVADLMSTPSMIYSQPVPRVSTLRPDVPVELDVLLAKALALRPDDRFQSAGELQEAIRSAAYRSGLMYSSLEMAAHLGDVCGTDVASWLRSDVGDERGGGTELYENEDGDEGDSDAELLSDGDLEFEEKSASERSDPKAGSGVSKSQLKGGTQLTSIFAIRERARAEGRRDPTAPDERDDDPEPRLGPGDSQPILAPPPLRSRSGATPARPKWETEQTRHYPDGRPPLVADPPAEPKRAYADAHPAILDESSQDRTHPTPPPVDLDSEDRTRPKPSVKLEAIAVHDPDEPATGERGKRAKSATGSFTDDGGRGDDEQTIAELDPPKAAIDELRRPRRSDPPLDGAPRAKGSADDGHRDDNALPPPPRRGPPAPEREPTGKTLPFTPLPRRADVPTPAVARDVSAPSILPTDPTVVPSRREALRRQQRTHVVAPRSSVSFWRSRRVVLGALILALLAVGIALGVALSDPGVERDDPAATTPR